MPDFISVLTSQWIYTAFAIIALGSTLVIITVILSENRNPVKSLAWVTVLLLLPVVGLILYLFFGRNIKNTRMISRRSRRRLRRRETLRHRSAPVRSRHSGHPAVSARALLDRAESVSG